MATLYTSKTSTTTVIPSRGGVDITCAYATYTLTAALALNDVIQMVKVPAGATILDITLTSSDLDTNGSPTIVLDVGDGGDTDRFIDGSTIGQTGGITNGFLASGVNGHLYNYTSEDTIDVLVQAGPATGATSGSIKLSVLYTMNF